MTEAEREEIARSIYEAATEGYYVPPWEDLTSDRRWRWLRAAERAMTTRRRQIRERSSR